VKIVTVDDAVKDIVTGRAVKVVPDKVAVSNSVRIVVSLWHPVTVALQTKVKGAGVRKSVISRFSLDSLSSEDNTVSQSQVHCAQT
jgi:hypothetical protein